ncbi:hypothetical protein CYMTET_49897 [Cymbomonas tetramitiformis]|uniref:Cyclic nucleotide-binding domain-containing protein n=1 Tax=Cymbomonas tetramitiformis TaxID=36881 RepID=A0AAE0BQI0_9CHLO|nr:hypothetical protein CYMTET_49897 [Cymbomonas tetramitiformis]
MSGKRSKARITRVARLLSSVANAAQALEESKPQDHVSEQFSDIQRRESMFSSSPSVRPASPVRSAAGSVAGRFQRKTRFCRTWANLTATDVIELGVDKTSSLHSVSKSVLNPDTLCRQGSRISSTEAPNERLDEEHVYMEKDLVFPRCTLAWRVLRPGVPVELSLSDAFRHIEPGDECWLRDCDHINHFESLYPKAVRKVFKKDPMERSAEEVILLVRQLRKCALPFFQDHSEHVTEDLCRSMRYEAHAGSKVLFRKGDSGDKFFLVLSGTVSILEKAKPLWNELQRCRQGDFFGELALLKDAPRATTAICRSRTELLVMTKVDYKRLSQSVMDGPMLRARTLLSAVETITVNSRLVSSLARAMQWTTFSPTELICRQGKMWDKVMVIASGEVKLVRGTVVSVGKSGQGPGLERRVERKVRFVNVLGVIGTPSCIGEVSALLKEVVGESYVTKGHVELASLPKSEYLFQIERLQHDVELRSGLPQEARAIKQWRDKRNEEMMQHSIMRDDHLGVEQDTSGLDHIVALKEVPNSEVLPFRGMSLENYVPTEPTLNEDIKGLLTPQEEKVLKQEAEIDRMVEGYETEESIRTILCGAHLWSIGYELLGKSAEGTALPDWLATATEDLTNQLEKLPFCSVPAATGEPPTRRVPETRLWEPPMTVRNASKGESVESTSSIQLSPPSPQRPPQQSPASLEGGSGASAEAAAAESAGEAAPSLPHPRDIRSALSPKPRPPPPAPWRPRLCRSAILRGRAQRGTAALTRPMVASDGALAESKPLLERLASPPAARAAGPSAQPVIEEGASSKGTPSIAAPLVFSNCMPPHADVAPSRPSTATFRLSNRSDTPLAIAHPIVFCDPGVADPSGGHASSSRAAQPRLNYQPQPHVQPLARPPQSTPSPAQPGPSPHTPGDEPAAATSHDPHHRASSPTALDIEMHSPPNLSPSSPTSTCNGIPEPSVSQLALAEGAPQPQQHPPVSSGPRCSSASPAKSRHTSFTSTPSDSDPTMLISRAKITNSGSPLTHPPSGIFSEAPAAGTRSPSLFTLTSRASSCRHPPSSSARGLVVKLRGIASSVSEAMLVSFFQALGMTSLQHVLLQRLRTAAAASACEGFVRFADAAEGREALELARFSMNGRSISIQESTLQAMNAALQINLKASSMAKENESAKQQKKKKGFNEIHFCAGFTPPFQQLYPPTSLDSGTIIMDPAMGEQQPSAPYYSSGVCDPALTTMHTMRRLVAHSRTISKEKGNNTP